MNKRKILVIDTSVLLYDKIAIHSFPGNDVVIPLKVLDELDRFKDRQSLVGEAARYVNRFLDTLRKTGRLDEGITLEGDQTIRVETNFDEKVKIPAGLDPSTGDNQILATAVYLNAKKDYGTILKVISKDINLRVKCDALGIQAEDYYKDHVDIDIKEFYDGQKEIYVSSDDIDLFFENGTIELSNENDHGPMYPNQLVIARASDVENKSFISIYDGGSLNSLKTFNVNSAKSVGIEPRNKEQKFALNILGDPSIPLVSLTGIAGSGKTFLALMAGMSGIFNNTYKRIVITRSIQPVGKDLGFLPGDLNEKMDPWLAPFMDNFRYAFNDMSYFEAMRQKGQIEIAPLSYIRGRTFNDSFVIVDEAQNATIHELKTIITRIGKDSKIVLLGDTDQVDTPYIDSRSNGLTIIVEKFKETDLAGHVHLRKGQRADLATYASTKL